MTQPVWVTPAGSLGTIPEGVFYSTPVVATAGLDTVRYQVIAGRLPPGIQLNENGIVSGNPLPQSTVQGVPFDVVVDTTSKFVVRALTNTGLADRTFELTVSAQNIVTWVTPAGNIGSYVDGIAIADIVLQYNNSDEAIPVTVSLISGQLPPGLSLSDSGVISGYLKPNPASRVVSTNYTFALRVSNGLSSDVRTFSLLIFNRATMTADNTFVTADNTIVTGDVTPTYLPLITTPVGSIRSTRSDNFYAFQFTAIDFYNNPVEFLATTALPPGLTLDPNSGYLYGFIPYLGVTDTSYTFSIVAREVLNPTVISLEYTYSLTVQGPIFTDVEWLTPADPVERARVPSSLGAIENGATSTFYVAARNMSGIPLQYRLVSGSDSQLPQGLQLLPSGLIAGRVSFNTFALDGGTTTFDVGLNTVDQPTTFDMVSTFTVNAFSTNGFVSANKTFSIRVIRAFDQPYDNLYIQAMPPEDDRATINSLLQNPDIFVPELIYRRDDPNFGVATRVVYNHAYGLSAATLDDYVSSLSLNHYWKNLVLGEIKTAQALDDDGNVLYEVVYSEIFDDLVNNQDVSVGKQVSLAFPIDGGDSSEITIVYPNSLQNMRDQVIDTVGQSSKLLPRWMLSRQADGTVLGFTRAWVIAYTKPGYSGQIAYNVRTLFQTPLNLIDFKVDRYELDNFLTKNWNRQEQYWGFEGDVVTPHPPSFTRFDVPAPPLNELVNWTNNANVVVSWQDDFDTLATWTYAAPGDNNLGTTFDSNSLLFTAPVDMYSATTTTEFDKYLVFPKRNILE